MKFFHISDLHIGLKLMNHDLSADQKHVFKQIIEYAKQEKPDAVVVAGDIYDKAMPSAEAVELFDWFITDLCRAVEGMKVMLISGNHDSAPRVNVFRNLLSDTDLYMIGQPPKKQDEYIEKLTLTDDYGKVNFYLLPFVKPSMVKEICGVDEKGNNLSYDASLHKLIEREVISSDERNVFVSHQFYLPADKTSEDIERMDSEITVGGLDAIGADFLEQFDYAALGHLHKPMSVGSDIYRYSGTPMACSVSEEGQEKGVIMVEMKEKGHVVTKVLPLAPLRAVKRVSGSLEEVLAQACEDYVTVILTDKIDYDVIDMQDRIHDAFPYLLEIRRDLENGANYDKNMISEKEQDPYELCLSFIEGDVDEESCELLKEIINKVKGAL